MSERMHVYLAAPYRGEPAEIRERMAIVSRVCCQLRLQGHFVTSPLLHHFTFDGDAGDGSYWLDYSENLIVSLALTKLAAPQPPVIVCLLQLPGWAQSSGIARELEVARRLQVPVHLIDADGNINLADVFQRS